jgi:hypothetical protein
VSEGKIQKNALVKSLATRFDEISRCYMKKDILEARKIWKKQFREEDDLFKKRLAEIAKQSPLMTAHYHYIMKIYGQLLSRILSISS